MQHVLSAATNSALKIETVIDEQKGGIFFC
jgi:hypothetical protein